MIFKGNDVNGERRKRKDVNGEGVEGLQVDPEEEFNKGNCHARGEHLNKRWS
jgi:hypothetical protein